MRMSKFREYSASQIYKNTLNTFSSYKNTVSSKVSGWEGFSIYEIMTLINRLYYYF